MADHLRTSIENQTSFSLHLTKHLFDAELKNPNLVFSPLSFHVVLSLLAAGSRGETLAQLLSFLRSGSIDELNSFSSELIASVLADGGGLGGPKTCYANSVWIQDYLTLKPSFKDIVDNIYRASLNKVDFTHRAAEILNEVNSWAEKETRGLIKEILPPGSIDSSTTFVLANALYFKGAWQHEFDAEETKEYDFHLLNGSSVRVPFMTNMEDQRLSAYDGFKVLGLPYKRGEDKRCLSMYIILPDAKDGLPALIERVASEPGFLDRHLPDDKYVEVGRFRIPKFKISFGLKASGLLKELGLVAPFNGGLTEMVDSFLKVSEIFHKSFIEVDEEGAEAAAVTAADDFQCALFDSPPRILKNFVADHPFLFLIREDLTGVVLFVGRVLDPSISP